MKSQGEFHEKLEQLIQVKIRNFDISGTSAKGSYEIHMKICGEAAFVLMNDLSFIRCNIYLFLTQQETAAKPADRDPLAFESVPGMA